MTMNSNQDGRTRLQFDATMFPSSTYRAPPSLGKQDNDDAVICCSWGDYDATVR